MRSSNYKMNDLLQKHGCSNVFTVPEGLKELMSDITREVLREQPKDICDFVSNYLSVLLITREHGVMAVRILEDLCDCRPSVSEHLLHVGLEKDTAHTLAQVIKDEIENFKPNTEKEKIKEANILKKILTRAPLNEEMAAKVCQIARNAYKDYWYKKKLLKQSETMRIEEPWEVAAERTLAIYKKTKPSLNELNQATERIQAAYRGYHVRRNLLKHLKPKSKKRQETEALPGLPLDVAGSREIDLGPVIGIKVREVDVNTMFEEQANVRQGQHDLNPEVRKSNKGVLDQSSADYTKPQDSVKFPTTRLDSATNPEVRVVQMESSRRAIGYRPTTQADIRCQTLDQRELFDSYYEEQISTVDDSVIETRPMETPARKISFSTVPPEVILNEYPDDDWEIQEAIQEALDEIGTEPCQEIPEDILDGGNDDDYSTPAASASSLISTDVGDQDEL